MPYGRKPDGSWGDRQPMPFIVRFVLIIAVLAGAVFGAVWALANFPPEQTEITKPISHEALRN